MTINNLDLGDYVTDGNGEYAQVKCSPEIGWYYTNIGPETIPNNEKIHHVYDLDVDVTEIDPEKKVQGTTTETTIKPANCGLCSHCTQFESLGYKISCSKLKTKMKVQSMDYITPRCPLEENWDSIEATPGPFALEINTPVKLPRDVALAFTEGNVSDGMTLVIEAVYIDGLLTLRSMEVTNDGQQLTDDESIQYAHSCTHFVNLYDITIDPVVDDDYTDVFCFPDLVWDERKWVKAPVDEWNPLGE